MDKKLRKDILTILKDAKVRINLYSLKDTLKFKYKHSEEGVIGYVFSNQVLHLVKVLEGELLITKVVEDFISGGVDFNTYIELTAKGYSEFSPWYKRFWDFINNDVIKLLSLVSLILSILATWISLRR